MKGNLVRGKLLPKLSAMLHNRGSFVRPDATENWEPVHRKQDRSTSEGATVTVIIK